uniref:Uncharacterized protein n=1 Tax=Megaviridae environmental sample TaxID=1737588 RepID=A0A5J6VL84_9VIRU|nr:MAG: hypothetical protein [Megaviridae environmental sample]
MLSKQCRNLIRDYLYDICDRLPIPNHVIAFLIKSGHLHYPIYSLIFIICLPLPIAFFYLFLSICSFIGYIFFDGCILTMLEYKLNDKKDDIHIIDFLLYLLHYDITNENRINVTLIVAGYYFILVFFILWVRTMYFKKN